MDHKYSVDEMYPPIEGSPRPPQDPPDPTAEAEWKELKLVSLNRGQTDLQLNKVQ